MAAMVLLSAVPLSILVLELGNSRASVLEHEGVWLVVVLRLPGSNRQPGSGCLGRLLASRAVSLIAFVNKINKQNYLVVANKNDRCLMNSI